MRGRKKGSGPLSRRRVVVTGMGAITPLGLTVQETWEALVAGRPGVGPITLFDATDYPVRIAAEVKGFEPTQYISRKEARRMARCSHFAIAATLQALADAHLTTPFPEPERVGVLLGTGFGGFDEAEKGIRTLIEKGLSRVNPFVLLAAIPNIPACNLARFFGAKGHNYTVTTACAAGTHAIGEAAEVIRRGDADVMITGGTEALICEAAVGSFAIMRALSTRNDEPERASRPFDARRDGFVLGEGCAILILEELGHALSRGARIYAEIAGYASTSDAYHLAAPEPQGEGAMQAMRGALEDAGLGPEDIDYINAHGTSTPLGDAVETLAIKRLFGERAYRVPISSTKSMLGHSLGAAGAIEAMVCVLTIVRGLIHPTINYEYPDPACDLDYVPNVARSARVKAALSNSFGFGGQNACLVITAPPEG